MGCDFSTSRISIKLCWFQSTHPHGVRQTLASTLITFCSFNPRTHMGSDTIILRFLRFHFMFQSTHPHGVRPNRSCASYTRHVFQSTHPHGVRPIIAVMVSICLTSFNPRTHMGCDSALGRCSGVVASFNPRTHMGCDLLLLFSFLSHRVFQSTHPHGGRHTQICKWAGDIGVSIHAPTWGAT